MYGLDNLKCTFTYSTSWMICRTWHTSGVGQITCNIKVLKQILSWLVAHVSIFSFFSWETNYPVAPAGNYNVLMQQTWHAVFFSSGITTVISITLYLLILLTMYQVLCNIKAFFPPTPKEMWRLGRKKHIIKRAISQ